MLVLKGVLVRVQSAAPWDQRRAPVLRSRPGPFRCRDLRFAVDGLVGAGRADRAEALAGSLGNGDSRTLGERRGDFVAVTSGLKAEQTVVSTGVFKLRNGLGVVIDNTLSPEFKLAPQPKDS